jgi:hypothetical protein
LLRDVEHSADFAAEFHCRILRTLIFPGARREANFGFFVAIRWSSPYQFVAECAAMWGIAFPECDAVTF